MAQPANRRLVTEATLNEETAKDRTRLGDLEKTTIPKALSDAKTYADTEVGKDRTRLSAIEGRELPNRGRLYPLATAPAGATGYATMDDVVISGKYAIWTASDAAAFGLSPATAGTVSVYAFGNVVEQVVQQHGSSVITTIARRKAGATWSAWKNPAAYDPDIAALITPGTATYRAILAALSSPSTPTTTKTAAMSLTTGDGGGKDVTANRSARLPFKVAAKVHKFRVHLQNTNPRYGNKVAGALAFKGLAVGKHATGSTTEGQFASPATSIATNFTTSAVGSDYVSPWVESGLEANTDYLLSFGFTSAAGQEVSAMVGGGWITDSADDWNVAAPTGLTATRSAPLYVWLELVIDSAVPVIMYFGDSLSSGVSARLGMYDSWPNKHALAHGHIATHYSNSGTTMGDHLDPAHFRWNRYAAADSLAKPDACWFAMGSNDVFGGTATRSVLDERFSSCFETIRANFTQNIGLCTILPRHAANAASEPLRKEWNEFLLTKAPEMALMTADAAALITAVDGDTVDKRYTAAPTDIHLTAAGYSRFMQAVPPLHR